MEMQSVKRIGIIALAFWLTGCMVNPTPNSGHFAMSAAQTQEVQRISQETNETNRRNRKADAKDAAEVRAWESRNSRPVNTKVIIARPVYY